MGINVRRPKADKVRATKQHAEQAKGDIQDLAIKRMNLLRSGASKESPKVIKITEEIESLKARIPIFRKLQLAQSKYDVALQKKEKMQVKLDDAKFRGVINKDAAAHPRSRHEAGRSHQASEKSSRAIEIRERGLREVGRDISKLAREVDRLTKLAYPKD
jgi:hypothetical protein